MPTRLVCTLLFLGSASWCAGAQSEEKAVLAVVQQLFDAMAAHDSAAARAALVPEGRYFSVRENGAQVVVGGGTHQEFAERLAGVKEAMLERMFEPRVLIHGRIAMVWTAYDFHRNRKFSHCGVDSFSLLKTSDGWKIAGIIYTAETAGCASRPLPPDNRQ